MVILPDIFAILQILSSEYTYMHPEGTSFRAPVVKFLGCLDLDQNPSFLDKHGWFDIL
jgi:hypothetical protein